VSSPASSYSCPWCRTTGPVSDGSCSNCGAPLDVRAVTTASGWAELPPIEDMARLQMGQSSCQVEGAYVPVADMRLATGDGVYFTSEVLLWQDPSVELSTLPLRGGWKRMRAGLPLIMLQAHGPGHIAFTRDVPGELVAVPLQPGWAVDVREHHFVVATSQVGYDWFDPQVWFTTRSGDETEWHYPVGRYMDRFTAGPTPGLLLLHAGGNVFLRDLAQGETILVKPPSLVYKDPTVSMQLHIERPAGTWSSWGSWGNRYLWLRLWGPGRVAVQSAYERFEDPGASMRRCSPCTEWQW
jgi:uncharacterized protein (AIM24 family)